MTARQRFGALVALVTVMIFGTSPVVLADEVSQGRTLGGTAYGGKGQIEVRRPGISPGFRFESTIGGKTFGGRYVYLGYETTSSGSLSWFRRIVDGGTFKVGVNSSFNPRSLSFANVEFDQPARDRLEWYINGAFAGGASLTDARFDTILTRMVMPNGIALSGSENGGLQYLANINSNYIFWGEPTAIFRTSGSVCGRFIGSTNYRYAFGGQPC